MYDSLISPKVVQENLETKNWCFFDCRFDLKNPNQKFLEFKLSHIPKANYVSIENDLSDPSRYGKNGRHPLPKIEELLEKISFWGIDSSVQVVVYDDFCGAHAARFWWILRWLGHKNVAVMDGGWPRWKNENRPVSKKIFSQKSRVFEGHPQDNLYLMAEDVLECCNDDSVCILDARSFDRYNGEKEDIDPVAGHIPSAVSAPHTINIDENGNWKSKSELRRLYSKLLQGCSVEKAITYCGSGITACQNILSMYYAGLGFCRIYPGSWSEWINDSKRPVYRGNNSI
tara:strand:+ start:362 stop:1219 length:858 start_codon:yes stop_codon:yes gene_type:complete